MPTVSGFVLDLAPPLPPAFIGHGALDPVISVEWSRRACEALAQAGADVIYHESPHMAHSIDPAVLRQVPAWLETSDGGATVTVRDLPLREQIDVPVREQLIVELYSK
jgi:acetyl esterase/lipase